MRFPDEALEDLEFQVQVYTHRVEAYERMLEKARNSLLNAKAKLALKRELARTSTPGKELKQT